MPKYIDFLPVTPDPKSKRKTKLWLVTTKGGADGLPLGFVKWFTAWRCYAFYPNERTVYERQCLRDLAEFCEQATTAHKIENRKSKFENP